MATEIPIEIISIFCQVLYKEDGTHKTRDFALLGEEAKELEAILNSEDASLSVDWAAEAATAHQELSQVLLMLHRNSDGRDNALYREMIKGLDKLRAIPGVGAELERRAAGREATAVPGSGRSPENPSVTRRK